MREFNEKNVIKGLIIIIMGSLLLGGVGYVLEHKLGIVKSGNEIAQENNNSSNDKFNIDDTKEFSKENIKTINVKTVSTDVNIITTKEDKIKVRFYGNSNSKKAAPYLETFANGNNLDVSIEYPVILAININTKISLDIYVPENYKKDLKINTTSGDAIIGNLQLDKFKFKRTSGDAKINLLTANETKFESTSGEVHVKSLLSKKNEFNTSSGDTIIENITGDILGESSSGCFKFTYRNFDNDINIDTTSGDVKFEIPKKSEFKLDIDSTSGNLKNDFPITVTGEADKHEIKGNVGNGNKTIKINTTSGNATINAFGQ